VLPKFIENRNRLQRDGAAASARCMRQTLCTQHV